MIKALLQKETVNTGEATLWLTAKIFVLIGQTVLHHSHKKLGAKNGTFRRAGRTPLTPSLALDWGQTRY